VHIDAEKPFWWDMPTWVALGLVDTVGIAHNHMARRRMHNSEAWGKARDPGRYGNGPYADAYYTQDLYYRLLDAGIRLAPSAGSASGVLESPVGYNRVYVHTGSPLVYDAWWQGLKAGHSFVTNGPLLLVKANGEDPGHVFQAKAGKPVELLLSGQLLANDEITSVEIVRNHRLQAAGYDAGTGVLSLPPQTFAESGWFLVRAVCRRPDTFCFASTAPFYVEVGKAPRRISRAAVTFWAGWVKERIGLMRAGGAGSDHLDAMLEPELEAERFWQAQLGQANAD